MQAAPSSIDIKLRWPQPSGITVHSVGPRRTLLLWIDGDEVRAYCNLCRHLPIPLAGGTGQLDRLQCSTHGAIYDPRSGECTRGPCVGRRLHPLEAALDGDGLRIRGCWPPD
ncbi:MAG: Rieske (2Fe-2S) protein [Myxococcota bacterium]